MKIIIVIFTLFLNGCSMLRTTQPREAYALRYNYLENNWTYAPSDAQLKFNYMEKKFEFAK